MRPPPFVPQPFGERECFVVDGTTGLIWHRVFNRVLYADTDRAGGVYHANYLRYFELGRTEVMRQLAFPYREVEEQGYVYPVIELGMSYHRPLHYDSPMWVHTRPTDLERVRVGFEYVITHAVKGDVCCKGFTIHCATNQKGVPVAVDPMTARTWQSFPSAE